jgi:hypothetical protein
MTAADGKATVAALKKRVRSASYTLGRKLGADRGSH